MLRVCTIWLGVCHGRKHVAIRKPFPMLARKGFRGSTPAGGASLSGSAVIDWPGSGPSSWLWPQWQGLMIWGSVDWGWPSLAANELVGAMLPRAELI